MIRVAALGQNLAVFRGLNSAQVHVTDTYCPVGHGKIHEFFVY